MKAINQTTRTLMTLTLLVASLSFNNDAFGQDRGSIITADDLICTVDLSHPTCNTSGSGTSGSGSSGNGQGNVRPASESQYVQVNITKPKWARYIWNNQKNHNSRTLVPVARRTVQGVVQELRRWTSAINGSNRDGSHLVVTLGPGRWVPVSGPQAVNMPTAVQVTEWNKDLWRYHDAKYQWLVHWDNRVRPYLNDARPLVRKYVKKQKDQYDQAMGPIEQTIKSLEYWIKVGSPQ